MNVTTTKSKALRIDKPFILGLLFFALSLVALPTAWTAPPAPDTAIGKDAFDGGKPQVEARLLIDAEAARPGDVVDVGVLFTMEEDWHIYWCDPGQGGMSTEVLFEAQPGQIGALQWPTPQVYHEGGGTILTFGYDGQVLLFAPMTIPDDAQSEVQISALVNYLVCKIDCIPGEGALVRNLTIGDERIDADELTAAAFEEARERLPRAPEQTGVDVDIRYSQVPIRPSEEFFVQILAVGCQNKGDEGCVELADTPERAADAFVFDQVRGARLQVARVSAHPDAHSGWVVELQGRASRDKLEDDGSLSGVLRLKTSDGEELATTVDALFPRQDSKAAQALALNETAGPKTPSQKLEPAKQERGAPSLIYILILAFLGGALLNLMPCVFPVLAIKVFSFVNLVHQERQSIYIHSAAYTAGIVASMMVLAAAVIALQMVGTQVGWGFQFQEPRFIAIIGAVLVVFALNLFGLFEVTLNPGKLQEVATAPPSAKRSAAEGVLAVVLATPCSAPFLGTAVGFALASSPAVIALIFFVLAMGLAMPFVVLTLTPGAAKFLPRPGAWMTYFKQFLGFALLATAIWLVWLVGQMLGIGAVTGLLTFFLACALGAWIFGIFQFRAGRARIVGAAAAVIIIGVAAFFTLRFDDAPPAQADSTALNSAVPWQPWSEEAVQSALSKGQPVFIDFTADWCITCKVNKKNVIETDEIVAAMNAHQVVPFMADWTRRDEEIRLKLAEFGKAGVPMYLLYDPADPKNPTVLPELLTKKILLKEIEKTTP